MLIAQKLAAANKLFWKSVRRREEAPPGGVILCTILYFVILFGEPKQSRLLSAYKRSIGVEGIVHVVDPYRGVGYH